MGEHGFDDDFQRLDAARARLRSIGFDLETARWRAQGLARETDWSSSTASAFHVRAEQWGRTLAVLQRRMEDADDRLAGLRARLSVLAGR